MNRKPKIENRKLIGGFTLIELILYIALISIFLTGAVMFAWDVVYGREKAFQQQIVDQSARIAMERIAYEIRRAEDVISVTNSPSPQLVLDNGGSNTTIELGVGGTVIQITTGGAGTYNLTSNQARVTSMTFSDLSTADSNSKDVKVSFTVEQAQAIASGQLTALTTVAESVELNSQFNQSRRLLVDLSTASLVGGTSVGGITIENTGSDDVVIDQLDVSWTGTAGGENITEVQIGAGGVEWSGSSGTDTTVDLTDFTLATIDGIVDIDYVAFDSNMDGATLNLGFVTGDGSTNKVELILQSGATATNTPTPTETGTPTNTPTNTPTFTPTPTDSPINTCQDYCVSLLYSAGTCRKNAKTCGDNGETNEAGGDQYCTGGPNADTCCCLP